jgi:hypothetical protein
MKKGPIREDGSKGDEETGVFTCRIFGRWHVGMSHAYEARVSYSHGVPSVGALLRLELLLLGFPCLLAKIISLKF